MELSSNSKRQWKPGQNGKGDAPRVSSFKTYQDNFENIFKKKAEPKIQVSKRTTSNDMSV